MDAFTTGVPCSKSIHSLSERILIGAKNSAANAGTAAAGAGSATAGSGIAAEYYTPAAV